VGGTGEQLSTDWESQTETFYFSLKSNVFLRTRLHSALSDWIHSCNSTDSWLLFRRRTARMTGIRKGDIVKLLFRRINFGERKSQEAHADILLFKEQSNVHVPGTPFVFGRISRPGQAPSRLQKLPELFLSDGSQSRF
jgi:hypothetical protein